MKQRDRITDGISYGILIFLFAGTLFCSSGYFADEFVLSKKYAFIFFTSLLGCAFLLNRLGRIFVDELTIFVFSFIFYLSIVSVFTTPYRLDNLCLSVFLLLFVFFRTSDLSAKYIHVFITVLCLAQAIYGLFQYAGLVPPPSKFPIVGSFDNPAGFSASLAAAFPIQLTLYKYSKSHKALSVVSCFLIAAAILLSESRTGIICISVVASVFLYARFGCRLGKWRNPVMLIALISGIVGFIGLLLIKKDSASGRLLIWEVSWNMIRDNPVFGSGRGSFIAHYMDYQANYFSSAPDSRFGLIADSVTQPFNEFILLLVEFGFIGIGLFIAGIIFLYRSGYFRFTSPHTLCLLSIGILSLFSYPFRYPFTWVILAYSLAQTAKAGRLVYVFAPATTKRLKPMVVLPIVTSLFFLVKDIAFEYKWKQMIRTVTSASVGTENWKLNQGYEELYNSWNGNPYFLHNYGVMLNIDKQYAKSQDVLDRCTQYFNDYNIQLTMADNHLKTGYNRQAELRYITASHMCPCRFIPLYKLHQLYISTGDKNKARLKAEEIVKKEIKIPSPKVYTIKAKMKKFLYKNE